MRGSDNQSLIIFLPICEILASRSSGLKLTRTRDSKAELSDEGRRESLSFRVASKIPFSSLTFEKRFKYAFSEPSYRQGFPTSSDF